MPNVSDFKLNTQTGQVDVEYSNGVNVSKDLTQAITGVYNTTTGQTVLDDASRAAVARSLSLNGASPDTYHGYWSMGALEIDITKGPLDLTGNARTMTLGAGSAAGTGAGQAYNVSGYYSSYAVANSYATSTVRPNWATDMMVGAFTVNMAAPAGLVFFAGSMTFGSTSEVGLLFGCASDGLLKVWVSGGGAYTTNANGLLGAGAGTVADGTDHKVVWAWDYKTRGLYVWVDGVLQYSLQGVLSAAPNPLGQWVSPLYYGANKTGVTGIASKFSSVLEYYQTGGVLPVNIGNLASTYSSSPQDFARLFDSATKDVDFFIAGQSNQQGQGPAVATNSTGYGSPIKDPTWPNGASGKRSSWPAFCARMGLYKYKANVKNYAVGSTSIVESWCGRVRDYTVGMWLKLGTFAAQGGRIYKITAAASGNNSIAQSTISTLSNGATDGAFTWSDFGADTGFRGVASQGSVYWDPSGNISALLTAIGASDSTRKMLYIAWGETDANISVSRADYKTGLVNLTNVALSAGVSGVMLGHTFGTPGAFYPIYDSNLVPGLNDAVASFSGDYRVTAGGQLYRAFGVMPTNPASGLGVQADGLHGNNAAYDAAGVVIANDALRWLVAYAA